MKLKFKKLYQEAKLPIYSNAGDAGIDLYAHSISFENSYRVKYGTGVAVEIPQGYVGLLLPRSSVVKRGLRLANGTGVIDSNFRGEILAYFQINTTSGKQLYYVGDRVAQLVVVPCPTWEIEEYEQLSSTERGDKGFGSSGQ